jgi:peptidoglycan hydrolase-like amidase
MTPKMTSRFALLLAAMMAWALFPAIPAAASTDEPVWILEGAGWGHGVGMSQYGAYGMALDGSTAAEIIAHYYSGAYLDDLTNREVPTWWTEPFPLVVGLAQELSLVTIQPTTGDAQLCEKSSADGGCATVRTISEGETWTVSISGSGSCSIDDGSSVASMPSCNVDVTWTDDGLTRVKTAGLEYAHGTIQVRPDGAGALNVLLDIALEQYLRGIAEMPSDWPQAALEAQAIAARNYAVRRVLDTSDSAGNPTRTCGCHLYDNTYDQVYAGWSKEGISSTWTTAVEATTGRVAVHPSIGRVFTAYYSSSSGGATEPNESVWGGDPIAYLQSVDDSWAVAPQTANPNRTWSREFTDASLRATLGWDSLTSVELIHAPPGAVVRFAGVEAGREVTRDFRGDNLRTTFGLKSPWVSQIISPYGFRDLAGSVHSASIQLIFEAGITKGCNPPDNTLFCPDELVTRGQMAAFLARALDLKGDSASHFVDTDGSSFDVDANRLFEAGITRGCNPPVNDHFCPDATVTRGQMAAFMVRAFGYEASSDVGFIDDDLSVFEADISKLAAAGVTKGCNPPQNDRFCPDEPVTRAQMASFLARALDLS